MFNNNNKINKIISLVSNIMKHNTVGIGNIETQLGWKWKYSFQEIKQVAESTTQD